MSETGGALLIGSIRVSRDTWFDVVAHEAPPRGTYWDPEDGPRPVNGVEVCIYREIPVCNCRGHNTCYACELTDEEVVSCVRVRGAHESAWASVLEVIRSDYRYAPLFADGAQLVARFKGGQLVRVRRAMRRRARYVPLHATIVGG